ncbi:IS4 family transposase [Roseibacillus ishigakijimensis]|uniref:IS4 family transposase n=1 Tax=Roseibacillus ishigakijimensis TaxID=454146 RepID=A0A934RQN7_9BACT|nr:IS4 family transposase [Roseibacillus ishigakijimensis]MBK1835709.1 IS4 family transposase [Roseibacillus ishigakijimensis]
MLHDHLINQFAPLKLNLARLKCLSLLAASLLRHRTVNLTLLATENLTGATNESCYRRFQRFFRDCSLSPDIIGRLVLAKVPRPEGGWVLSMDRTNWKYGQRHINILTIGIVVNKVAIPIAWKVLPQSTKRGNSSTRHRIALCQKVLQMLPSEDIRALVMDREFGGKDWLEWLDKQGVGYIARIKTNIIVGNKLAREHRATGKGKKAAVRKKILGMSLFFASKTITSKGRRDERLHLISNRFYGAEALELYKLRWGIEQLFSHLKKRGFNLEDTHMSDAKKLEKLFAVVTLAFLYSYGWGCHLRTTRKTPKAMARKSLFRQGLESILRLLNNPHLKAKDRNEFLAWLKSPFHPSIFVV